MNEEEWRPVADPLYRDRYEVSNMGRVKALGRLRMKRINGVITPSFYPEKMLTQVKRKAESDHLCVSLYGETGARIFAVHVLVLLAFAGPRPDGMQGLHNNDIATDNRYDNLRWGTPSDNVLDRMLNGGQRSGDDHPCTKVSKDSLARLLAGAISPTALAAECGVSVTYARRLASGHLRHVTAKPFNSSRHLVEQRTDAQAQETEVTVVTYARPDGDGHLLRMQKHNVAVVDFFPAEA